MGNRITINQIAPDAVKFMTIALTEPMKTATGRLIKAPEITPCNSQQVKSTLKTTGQAIILAGMDCAIMPMLPGIATRIVVEPEIQRTVQLVTVSGRRYSPPVQSFIRLVQGCGWTASA